MGAEVLHDQREAPAAPLQRVCAHDPPHVAEIRQRGTRLATEFQGADALDQEFHGGRYDDSDPAPWMRQYLITYGGTISAGASEIQRNIIAQRVLGLPRR